MKSQVTTKSGDHGKAMALDGQWYSKAHPIMEATGAVDEFRGHAALIRQLILQEQPEGADELAACLLWILHCCFIIGTECSDPEGVHPEYRQGVIGPEALARLEKEQAWLEDRTRLPQAFIVTASTPLAAQIDIASAVARRLERSLVRLHETAPAFGSGGVLAFVNRLSDYLYMLARHVEGAKHTPVDYAYFKAYEGRKEDAE